MECRILLMGILLKWQGGDINHTPNQWVRHVVTLFRVNMCPATLPMTSYLHYAGNLGKAKAKESLFVPNPPTPHPHPPA